MAELSHRQFEYGLEYQTHPDFQRDISMTVGQDETGEDTERDPNLVEERFRVDRRKLEQMLQAADEEEAELFFQNVMHMTETHISWPSKLKIGAKSKKDPHIKIAGTPAAVANAKDRIMEVLDTKSNRVTLKMDVSHTEHSHVIGKGGNNIKKVMQDTGCHIHFPDSNRNNQAEKSNQVSIAGQPVGAESARAQIRELLPLVFMFELPVTGIVQPIPDTSSPHIQQIQQTHNVTVTFKQRPRMYITTVLVRGTVSNAKAVKEATGLVVEHLTGNLGQSLPVSMTMEIAPQHHLFIMGRGGMHVKQIMQRTGASIHFPDPNNVTPQRKGTVYITGGIESVSFARQQLIGCLPLVLMFDMKEDQDVDQKRIGHLMEQLDVFISIKPKPKQPSKSVIVKSIERNSANMYEARRLLLGLERDPALPPPTKLDNSIPGLGMGNLSMIAPNLLSVNTANTLLLMNGHNTPHPPAQSPELSPTSSAPSPRWITSPSPGLFNPFMLVTQSPLCTVQTPYDVYAQCNGIKDLNQNSALIRVPSPSEKGASSNNGSSSTNSPIQSPCQSPSELVGSKVSLPLPASSPLTVNNVDTHRHIHNGSFQDIIIQKRTSPNNSGSRAELMGMRQPPGLPAPPGLQGPPQGSYQDMVIQKRPSPNNSGSRMELTGMRQPPGLPVDPRKLTPNGGYLDIVISPSNSGSGQDLRGIRQPSGSPCLNQSILLEDSVRNAPFQYAEYADNLMALQLESNTMDKLSESSVESDGSDKGQLSCDRKAPGAERPSNVGTLFTNNSPFPFDYEQKKKLATKAMQKKPDGESRIPTDIWSGLGFSKSMPESAIREQRRKQANMRAFNGLTGPNGVISEGTEPVNGDIDRDPWKDSRMRTNIEVPISAAPGDFPYTRNRMESTSRLGSMSNHMDAPGTWNLNNEDQDLVDLFSKIGLGKYADLFQQQEIDMATFMTLTDQDLKELGISTFGARRKMLLAIADLSKKQSLFPPSPSPSPSIPTFTEPPSNPFAEKAPSTLMVRRHDIISQSGRW
ncbi:protein bicaudal C homolog 1-like isoform X2 [Lineus longissimus]|uniref:protein bicaudal C homolog 1-like isoform X2 n=1 Tax=Lineus longissimus TaxID=88925 RepID=UPI00315DD338